ncbi:MAG: NfeD family protein [Opitutaceae bacterium]|jgi:membrane-bound serine protease (ClpP class)
MATLLLALLFPLLARSGEASAAGAVESAPSPAPSTAPASALAAAPTRVMVIPVREEIATPILYIIRRGLKEAIEQKADVVVLDMKTPGGALDVTFEIMEALGRFPGRTITYVNTEAISAGAFISAMTSEIWFAPTGVIGAAAPVMATGGEIDASMKQKIVSYLRARVRAVSEGKGYRGEVISAMIDANYELKIGDKIIKPKGELLSLTASEANERYGDPAQPLLAAGTAATLDELLTQKLGATAESTRRFEVSWSEKFAVLLNSVRPLLLGLGLLLAFIEFKTPGFGVFGISAAVLLAAVFFGHYIAGFSGHEPVLVFVLGLLAVMVELIFFPGVVVVAAGGLLLMLGSLVWSMADLWPNEPITFSPEVFLEPVANLVAGLGVAVVLGLLLARFLPRGWIWDRMVLATSVSGAAQMAGSAPDVVASAPNLIGARGVAVTGLYPSGQVEVDGHRYEARLAVGSVERGAAVVVRSRSEFGLVVETIES